MGVPAHRHSDTLPYLPATDRPRGYMLLVRIHEPQIVERLRLCAVPQIATGHRCTHGSMCSSIPELTIKHESINRVHGSTPDFADHAGAGSNLPHRI